MCAVKTVEEAIYNTTTEAEVREIAMNVVADDTSHLSVEISGPEEIVNKIEAVP